jgi:exodeoxyribonuclease-3
MQQSLSIYSWNVNGIRAAVGKGLGEFLKTSKPDILGLQEIKIDRGRLDEKTFDFPGYREIWHPAKRPGYSGTALLVKEGVNAVPLPDFDWDDEGRVQIADIGLYYLANIYFPNANHELSRLDFKIDFNDMLLKEFKRLEKIKPLLIGGDYNVAHEPIDLARPKENEGNPGYTVEERTWMSKFLKAGFIDTFRQHHPTKVQYSWWSYRMGARSRNVGWRIDYWCVSKSAAAQVKDAFILDQQTGSDHAPVGLVVYIQ